MTQVRDLPQALQDSLLKQDYGVEANVIWLSEKFADARGDVELAFTVHDPQKTTYVHVNAQGESKHFLYEAYHEPRNLRMVWLHPKRTTKANPTLAQWARQTEASLSDPSQSIASERAQSHIAENALEAYFQQAVPEGVFRDGVSLPAQHPAKDFLETVAQQTPLRESLDDFEAMKSTRVFYDFGRRYSESQAEESDQKLFPRILYPAADHNVGALATAFALIEGGAIEVEMIATEAAGREHNLDRILKTLQHWSLHNPNLKIIEGNWQAQDPNFAYGKRYGLTLAYLGRWIHLTYALGDVPQRIISQEVQAIRPWNDFFTQIREGNAINVGEFNQRIREIHLSQVLDYHYFDPQDWMQSDLILLHDNHGTQTELQVFKQMTEDRSIISQGQDILVTEGYFDFSGLGEMIPGSYGNSRDIQINGERWDGAGASYARGARWVTLTNFGDNALPKKAEIDPMLQSYALYFNIREASDFIKQWAREYVVRFLD